MAQKIINKEILITYFKGESTPLQNKEIEIWLKDNPDNIACFEELKTTWDLYEPVEIRPPAEEDWTFLLSRIQAQSQKPTKKNKIIPIILKYAAVFAFGFGLYFVFDYITSNENDSLAEEIDYQYNEIIVPKGEKSQVVLSDGTKVWLNADSKLRYPSNFNDRVRTVYLEGEAYFDVTHQNNQTFIVKTDQISVRVLGTKFNVKSYPEDEFIETTLVSGRIVIESESDKDHAVELKPNQKATFSKVQDIITVEKEERESSTSLPLKQKPITIAKVDTEPIISWKDQELVFDNETLVEAGVKLERWYGVQIEVNNEELKNIRYRGRFDNHYTLIQVLEVIKLTTPIRYTTAENKVIIDLADEVVLQKKKRK